MLWLLLLIAWFCRNKWHYDLLSSLSSTLNHKALLQHSALLLLYICKTILWGQNKNTKVIYATLLGFVFPCCDNFFSKKLMLPWWLLILEYRKYFTDYSHIFNFKYTHSRLFAYNLNGHKTLQHMHSGLMHNVRRVTMSLKHTQISKDTWAMCKVRRTISSLHVYTLNFKK